MGLVTILDCMVQVVDKKEITIMKKICFAVLCVSIFLFMISVSFADESTRAGTDSAGKTTFGNIAVVGLNNTGSNAATITGTPGYLEMTNGSGSVYYLWISTTGKLMIATDVAVGTAASPNTVGWADSSGIVVGGQS